MTDWDWDVPAFLVKDDTVVLHPYQRKMADRLIDLLRDACKRDHKDILNRIVMLVSMMGSGKTLILRYVAERLIREGLLRGVVVVVPMNSIKEGWVEPFEIKDEFHVPDKRWMDDAVLRG
jgi:superfamily II DNA or RNA helicase